MKLFNQWLGVTLLSLGLGGFVQLIPRFTFLDLFSFLILVPLLMGLLVASGSLLRFPLKTSFWLSIFVALSSGFYYFHFIASPLVPAKLSLFMGWTVVGLIILSSFFILTADKKDSL